MGDGVSCRTTPMTKRRVKRRTRMSPSSLRKMRRKRRER
jgi:hypothetical protein